MTPSQNLFFLPSGFMAGPERVKLISCGGAEREAVIILARLVTSFIQGVFAGVRALVRRGTLTYRT